MSDDSTLRMKARHAIRTGRLPNHRPDRMWGGPGDGTCCAVCGKPLMNDEIGLELQFTREGTPSHTAGQQLHLQCFKAWEHELLGSAGGAPPPLADSSAPRLPPAGAPGNGPLSSHSYGGIIANCERGTTD